MQNPIELFSKWFSEAKAKEAHVPDAMCLATVDSEGMPSTRMVLLKGFSENGFVFYTNLNSRKAKDLQVNPKASICFHWKSIKKQVRISGDVQLLSNEEADKYFESRPRQSQIGAWASNQSEVMKSSTDLEKSVAKYIIEFGVKKVPRPEFWSGYRIIPKRIEFWEDRSFRLHLRFQFVKEKSQWIHNYLFP